MKRFFNSLYFLTAISLFLFGVVQPCLAEVLPPSQAKQVLRALKLEVNKGYLKCTSPQYPTQSDFSVIFGEYLKDKEMKISREGNTEITLDGISQTETRKNITQVVFTVTNDLKKLVGAKLSSQAILIRSTNEGDLLNPVFQETDVLMSRFDLNCK